MRDYDDDDDDVMIYMRRGRNVERSKESIVAMQRPTLMKQSHFIYYFAQFFVTPFGIGATKC